jgi:hypothetical protein
MPYRLLADLVVVLHLAFVVFAVLGGLLALRWRRAVWTHLPAALWAVVIECTGGICPLTPLENRLRMGAGEAAYAGDFIERHILPVLYPADLTRGMQMVLGALALAANLGIYGLVFWRARRKRTGCGC